MHRTSWLLLPWVLTFAVPASAVTLRAGIIQDFETDARSAALGSALTARPQGAFAAYWNPAGLALMETDLTVGIAYREILPDYLDDAWLGHAGAVYDLGTFGVGVNFGRLSATDTFRDAGGTDYDFEETQTLVQVGVAADLGRSLFEGDAWDLALGANVRYVKDTATSGEGFLFPGYDGDGIDADLAALSSWTTPVQIFTDEGRQQTRLRVHGGAMLENLLDQEVEYTIEGDRTQSDPMGRVLRLGLGADLEVRSPGSARRTVHVTVVGQYLDSLIDGDENDVLSGGIEVGALDTFYGRFGYYAFDEGDIEDVTAGFGLRGKIGPLPVLQLDLGSFPQAKGLQRVWQVTLSGSVDL